MGWAQRARERREACEVKHYRVRRWTAFEWKYPEGNAKSVRTAREKMRKDRQDHLKRSAGLIERKLKGLRPDWSPLVKLVSVGRQPQLLFELIVPGLDEDDARRRAMYVIERGLTAKVEADHNPPAREQRRLTAAQARSMYRSVERTLRPPWGKVELELSTERRLRLLKDEE